MLNKFAHTLSSALLWLLALAMSGAALTVAGVYVLSGPGWALVCGGGFFLVSATIIFKGLTRG